MYLYRVIDSSSNPIYFRPEDLIRAYRFAKKESLYSSMPIVLEKVTTNLSVSLEEAIQLTIVDDKPLWHHTTHLRYFQDGEKLTRDD